jgi:hypothetical protein
MQWDVLAREIDDRVRALPEGCDPARVFGVPRRDDGSFVLVPFWSGVARELPARLTPPDRCDAIALETGGWAAPLDEVSDAVRPSEHPQRRRIHHTCVVFGNGSDVSVLRYDDEPPIVLHDGVGLVLDLMRACWARRHAA